MVSLANECEASVGAVYRYFPGKEALMTGLQIRAIGALEAHLVVRLSRQKDPVARIEVAAKSWSTFAVAHPALFELVDETLSGPPSEGVEASLESLLSRMAGLFDEAEGSGLLRPGDSRLRTQALFSAVHGAGHIRGRDIPPTQAEVEAELISALLAGWRQ